MKYYLLIIILIVSMLRLNAQPTSGTTGLLNIPTAEMQRDGTFMFGGNYLPESITPERFSYNTGNYYINITFLPFWEVNYRLTLLQTLSTGIYSQQDRSFGMRIRLMKGGRYFPSIVIGGDDLYTHVEGGGNQDFGKIYAVLTKNIKWEEYNVAATLGYYMDTFQKNQRTGLFGGLAFTPAFFKSLTLMAEYDTKAINAGASFLLFDHLYLQAFVYDLKYFTAGIQYRVYLKKE